MRRGYHSKGSVHFDGRTPRSSNNQLDCCYNLLQGGFREAHAPEWPAELPLARKSEDFLLRAECSRTGRVGWWDPNPKIYYRKSQPSESGQLGLFASLFFSPWSPESGWNSTTLFCSKSLSCSSASGMGQAGPSPRSFSLSWHCLKPLPGFCVRNLSHLWARRTAVAFCSGTDGARVYANTWGSAPIPWANTELTNTSCTSASFPFAFGGRWGQNSCVLKHYEY